MYAFPFWNYCFDGSKIKNISYRQKTTPDHKDHTHPGLLNTNVETTIQKPRANYFLLHNDSCKKYLQKVF